MLSIRGVDQRVVLLVLGELTSVKEENITRVSREEWAQMKGQTDWDKVKAMTDEEIEQNALDDPDSQPIPDEMWDEAKVI
ncbi:MAG: hypothetical protein AAGF26_16730, partial [Cyanobacteria bacterium P01_G01_bin.49]